MLSHWLTSSISSSSSSISLSLHLKHPKPKPFSPLRITCLRLGVEDITQIAQNKVLVAATLSAVIGQLSKPFATSLVYGSNNVDLKRVFGAGGFPSTHSAGVVAAATSLGLERGFSDSIFGVTVIFAALVMYDAQAVRREVGNHAKVLNKTIVFNIQNKPLTNSNKDSVVDSSVKTSIFTKAEGLASLLPTSEKTSTQTLKSANTQLYLTSENRTSAVPSSFAIDNDLDPMLKETLNTLVPLEESIGHTLTEVVAGALLGFLVTIAVYSVM